MATTAQQTRLPDGAWATVLLGDWTRVVRDPIDLIRASYLVVAVYCLVEGHLGLAIRFGVTFLAVLLPRWLDAPRLFDLFFTATLGLQAWGNLLGWFGNNGNLFDRFDHVLSPMGVAPLFYLWLIRLKLVPDLREEIRRFSWPAIVLIGFSIGVTVGTVYEFYEYVANHFGAGLYVTYDDTIMDLLMDSLGALIGSVVLAVWARAGWGSRRQPRR